MQDLKNSTTEIFSVETNPDLRVGLCPLCKATLRDNFVSQGFQVQYCTDCGLKLINPQPSDQVLGEVYNATYFLTQYSHDADQKVAQIKRATASLYLDMLESYGCRVGGKLLEVGSGTGDLLVEAQVRGFEVTGIEYSSHAVATARSRLGEGTAQVICGEVETVNLPEASFDACVLSDVLEHARNPEKFLKAVNRLLKPGGFLFLSTPSLDSWSARLLGKHWMEYKTEHLYYFSRATLEQLLFSTNFNRVLLRPNVKVLTPGYICAHFDRYPVPLFTPLARLAIKLMPRPLADQPLKVVASGVVALSRKQLANPRRKLSVIVPAFNERNTFDEVMEQLLSKELDGLDLEIVVIESNSSDGTRELALKYQNHPRVKLILQEKPGGKGFAVRAGLAQATGDFVLIQDADLEYDMNDYADLLKPLLEGKTAFVLGSRHGYGGALKMRHFADQPMMSTFLNLGHILFTTLLNTLYGQHLKDPFTMYKVFRRDNLFGLKFDSNRFDFDYELVIKQLRKGYKPLEIPVSYKSRSFGEGKKVSLFRDPLTWIRALARFRVQPLNLSHNVREANLAEPIIEPSESFERS